MKRKPARKNNTSLFDLKKEKKITAPRCRHCSQYACFGWRGEMFCREHVPADFWEPVKKPPKPIETTTET